MRILHILNYYWPHLGGIEDVCKSLADGLPEVESKVLCYNECRGDATDVVDGIEVVRAGLWKEVARQQISTSFGRQYRRLLRSYRPDIIHFHAPNPLTSAIVLAYLPRRVKLVVHWHSDITVQPLIHFFYKPIERRMLRRADAIVATSPNYIEHSPYLQPFGEKCRVIPNVVSLQKITAKPASGLTENDIRAQYGPDIVLTLGRHVPYKGLDNLIEAVPLMTRKCAVLICGQGPETPRLKAAAASLPNVHFLGRIADDEIGTYLRAARVFAFPSVTKNEAFGIALAEAMYCGAVPVTFTIEGSGVNWVNLGGQTGLEVPLRDVAQYAAALDRLLGDERLRSTYAAAARKRVESQFLFEHIHQQLLKLYREL